MGETNVKYLKYSDIKKKREEIYEHQDRKCLICGETAGKDNITLDHQHKLFKNQPLIKDGAGLIRGVLCKVCNSWEGKIFKNFRRMGLHKKQLSLQELLRNLADYLDREKYLLIHPTEKPKERKISKRNYNTLKKIYIKSGQKKKFPIFPKSGKLTKPLNQLFVEFQIDPYNKRS